MITLTQEVIQMFARYYAEQPAWGSLHIVLDDGNVYDSSCEHCRQWAAERGDLVGVELAEMLLQMTKSQRGRLSRKVKEYEARQRARSNLPVGNYFVVNRKEE